MRCTWEKQKFTELLKKNYLKYLYKFETLVPFEVLPLRLDAVIPAPLPMLEHCLKSSTEKLSRAASDSLAALGAALGLLHPVTGGGLRRGLKFQTCTNILNNVLKIPGIFGPPTYIDKCR